MYPIPNDSGLGIHATTDVDGAVRFGPDVEWLTDNPGQSSSEVDSFCFSHLPDFQKSGLYEVDGSRESIFYSAIRKYYPSLADGALVPDYSGIRPKLRGPSWIAGPNDTRNVNDFVIEGPEQHRIRGLINLYGIESPGLTSSLALGDFVAQNILQHNSLV